MRLPAPGTLGGWGGEGVGDGERERVASSSVVVVVVVVVLVVVVVGTREMKEDSWDTRSIVKSRERRATPGR